jgi:thiol:disulfide interchange protein
MTLFRFILAAALVACAWPARAAVDPDDLLPVQEAFALSAQATERGRIEFHWKIADGYYLYKHRIAVQPVDSGFKFNPLELPPGEKKTDEFFGEVETYRGELRAVLTGAAASGVAEQAFKVRYQGCADVGICYPPHQQTITVALPAESLLPPPPAGEGGGGGGSEREASAQLLPPFQPSPAVGGRSSSGDNPLQRALGGGIAAPAAGTTEALPLPEEQAFGFEAIASSPTELLLRFTPAPGYYLYRDRSSFRVVGDAGTGLAAPRWPPGHGASGRTLRRGGGVLRPDRSAAGAAAHPGRGAVAEAGSHVPGLPDRRHLLSADDARVWRWRCRRLHRIRSSRPRPCGATRASPRPRPCCSPCCWRWAAAWS